MFNYIGFYLSFRFLAATLALPQTSGFWNYGTHASLKVSTGLSLYLLEVNNLSRARNLIAWTGIFGEQTHRIMKTKDLWYGNL